MASAAVAALVVSAAIVPWLTRLVPVANAVAGRLVLAALRPGGGNVAEPVLVDDALLANAPRTATAAVPGAVAADPSRSPSPGWTVCDEVAPRPEGRFRGLDHIAIHVGSRPAVDALTARLAQDGYPVVSPPRTTGDGYYEIRVLDSEGTRVEITG